MKIQCVATGGYPTPQVSWSEPEGADIDLTAEPEIITLTNDHTSNVYHTIRVIMEMNQAIRLKIFSLLFCL